MPTWFLLLTAICGCYAFFTLNRRMRNGGLYIWGSKISPLTMAGALIIILIGFGVMVAIQLGFIPDHAP